MNQWKFHNALAYSRLINVLKFHNAEEKREALLSNLELRFCDVLKYIAQIKSFISLAT